MTVDLAVRCSAWAREIGLPPIGTIGSYQGWAIAETPLPWPRDVGQHESLSAAAETLSEMGIRLQAVVPATAEAQLPDHRVTLYWNRLGSDGFGGYSRFETRRGNSTEAALTELVGTASNSTEPVVQWPTKDLLLCTHGKRDVCCGSLGTALALEVGTPGRFPRVHVRRTSHTGGHRFAPTFIILPEGTAWAYADHQLIESVSQRSVAFSTVANHYRGCSGLPSGAVQALEREVLSLEGWDVLDTERTGSLTGEVLADGGQVVHLRVGSTNWEAVARSQSVSGVPECMKPTVDPTKTETTWSISDLRSVG